MNKVNGNHSKIPWWRQKLPRTFTSKNVQLITKDRSRKHLLKEKKISQSEHPNSEIRRRYPELVHSTDGFTDLPQLVQTYMFTGRANQHRDLSLWGPCTGHGQDVPRKAHDGSKACVFTSMHTRWKPQAWGQAHKGSRPSLTSTGGGRKMLLMNLGSRWKPGKAHQHYYNIWLLGAPF